MNKKSYLALFSTMILSLPLIATSVEAYELSINSVTANNEKQLEDNQEESIKRLSTEGSTDLSNSTGSQKNSNFDKSKSDVEILEETSSNKKEEKGRDSTLPDNQNNSNNKSTTEQPNISSRLYTGSPFEQGKVGVKTSYSNGWGEGDSTIRLIGSAQTANFRASMKKVVQSDPDQRYILVGFRVAKASNTTGKLFDYDKIISRIYYDTSNRTGDVLSTGNYSDEFSSEALSGTDYQVSDYIYHDEKKGVDYTFTNSFRDSNKTFGIEAMIPTVSDAYDVSERIAIQALVKDTRNNNSISAWNLADLYKYTSFEGVHNAELQVKDTEISQNSIWDPRDNFISGTKFNGTEFINMGQTVKTSGTVDTSNPGNYPIEYSFEEKQSGTIATIKAIANIKVIANLETIKAHDITIYRGESWEPKDSFDSATDIKGNSIDLNSGVIISGANKVDTNKVGTYIVTYSSGSAKQDVTITVKDKQTAVNVHDSSIYVGDTWKSEDNFDSALDKDGNKVDFSQLTVDESKVDTTTAGVYEITYTYGGVTSIAKLTVKGKQTAVNVHDSSIYVGDTWKSEDNFDFALDKDGNKVDFSQLTVDDSKVNTTKAGINEVTYTYDGVTSTAKVTIYSVENNKDSKVDKIPMTKISKSKSELPKTGINDSPILLNIIGGITTIASLALFFRRKI
ncbi:bacterial Ig-like domain-containing protein [Lactococcus sp.]|uniref:bacterial Ig-like domain-containing protein n=3 Tax=Lactococcus sp. TaxID=44273 RepID=UPI002FC5B9CF